ncbi:nuclear transport factor 2 family protein [Streptomyces sp. NPDC049954]|uniref:nuclear transport factor 2 family protein n=1 Tax=Streptomyces sp. NPDC049954 TaxID=3155779 RepID=UPI00343D76B7
MTERPGPVDVTGDLPEVIERYLRAHDARDLSAAVATFAPEAAVTDDGRSYRGTEAIKGWLGRTASEYTYTTTLVRAERDDSGGYTVVRHLEGDFPGGSVDLRYRFLLAGEGLIGELVIAP